MVEAEALLSAVEEVVRFKKTDDVEVHIDGMGDPGAYPNWWSLWRAPRP
jgi:uncharacterized Fe-S cluster-containing radical SAM superfamily enzyme